MFTSFTIVTVLAICSIAHAWTGAVVEVYDVEQKNINYEGIIWYDNKLYTGTTRGVNIFRIDPGDLKTGEAAKVDGTSESATDLTAHYILGLCYSDDKEAIYATFTSGTGEDEGGIIMFDKDELKFQELVKFQNITNANDCIVSDEQKAIYATSSVTGVVMSCDLDLSSCEEYVSGGTLVPSGEPVFSSAFGANGIEYFDDSDAPYLIVGNLDAGSLTKVAVSGTAGSRSMTTVTVSDPLNLMSGVTNPLRGADGLTRVGDDVLIVVTAARVILLTSDDDFVTAKIQKVVSTGFIETDGSAVAALKYGDRASKSDI